MLFTYIIIKTSENMPEYKWMVLGITTVGVFMTSLDSSILNIAIPSISVDLKASFEVVQWIPIIYLLVMAITLIGFGRLADLHGRKNFYLIGLILFTFSSFLSMLATTGEILIIFRAIQGTGSSLIAANAPSMIMESFPRKETGKAMGINVAAIYLGLVIGPVLGGVLVQVLTWRSIFFINIPIGVVLIVWGFKKLKKSENMIKNESFDVFGTLFFGAFLAFLLIALTLANGFGWNSIISMLLFMVSIASFTIFIFIESKIAFPMLHLSLFKKNRIFAAANSAALFNYIATNGVGFLLSIYLQTILKIPPAITALLLLPTSLIMTIFSPLSGRISDKMGTRIICGIGMGIMALGFVTLICIIIYLPIEFVLLSQAILGVGIGLFSSPNQSAIMKSVENKDLGIAAGTLSTMRVVGQSISVALLSAILVFFIPSATLNPILSNETSLISAVIKNQFEYGMHVAFIVSAIICIFGAIISLVRGKDQIYK